jgi:hypothetical protein
VVYLQDYTTDWELWLTATAKHFKRVTYHILLSQEKIEIESMVSTECILLSVKDHKVEIL